MKFFSHIRSLVRDRFFSFLRKALLHDSGREAVRECLEGTLHSSNRGAVAELTNQPTPYDDVGQVNTSTWTCDRSDIIFLTGRFRSGSTLLWNVFRQLDGFTSDYEPFNERRWFDRSAGGERMDATQRSCGDQVQWVQGNAFEDGEFDFAYTFRFGRHFHKEDRDRLYSEFLRVLKPGGWLVLDAVNENISAPLRAPNPDGYPIYDKLYRDESALRDELMKAGFEAAKIDPVQRWFSLQYKAQVLLGTRSQRLGHEIIQLLERLRGGPFLEWIVTAKKQNLSE